jgi:bacteriorhodopsin
MFGVFGLNPWFILGLIAAFVICAALLVAVFASAKDNDEEDKC